MKIKITILNFKRQEPMNFQNKRFREMDRIGKSASKELPKLKAILQEHYALSGQEISEYVLTYFESRLHRRPLRAYYSYAVHCYLSHYNDSIVLKKNKRRNTKLFFEQMLPFLFEGIIAIQYLHNHILDDKYDSHPDNRQKLWQNLLTSNLLRQALYKYLRLHIKPLLLSKPYQLLEKRIDNILLTVDVGQYLDKEHCNYERYKVAKNRKSEKDFFPLQLENWLGDERCRSKMESIINETLEEFEDSGQRNFARLYFHRIYQSNVYFFRGMGELIAIFYGTDHKWKDAFIDFSIYYGFMIQVINDYSDFAYAESESERRGAQTGGKNMKDMFADLYNANITLPLMLYLQEDNRRKIEAYLEGGKKVKKEITEYPLQIKRDMVESGSIRKMVRLSRKLADLANSCLDPDNPRTPYLKNMTGMAKYNKFYKIFGLT